MHRSYHWRKLTLHIHYFNECDPIWGADNFVSEFNNRTISLDLGRWSIGLIIHA